MFEDTGSDFGKAMRDTLQRFGFVKNLACNIDAFYVSDALKINERFRKGVPLLRPSRLLLTRLLSIKFRCYCGKAQVAVR